MFRSTQLRAASLSSLMLVGFYVGLFGSDLTVPGLTVYDEFLTLDRSLGFLRTGDLFTVYTNCEPCWIKPPLHYYLGSLTIKSGLGPVEGVRIWSVVFAAASLWLVHLMTLHLLPEKPWCAPAAILFCGSSSNFAEYTRIAMMETGASFFILLSFYGALRATREPKYWLYWAAGCGLGAMQRTPLAWVLSTVWIYGLYRCSALPGIRTLFKDRWFRSAVVINILLSLYWPLVQTIRYGPMYRRHAVSRWIFRLTKGLDHKEGAGFGFDLSWIRWLLEDSAGFCVIAFLTLGWALSRPAFRKDRALWLLPPALPLIMGFTFSAGPFYSRYILAFTPLLAIFTAVALGRLIERNYVPILVALLTFFSNGDLPKAPYCEAENSVFDLRAAGHRAATRLRPDEVPVFVILDDPKAHIYGIEGMTQSFRLADERMADQTKNYLVVARSHRVGALERNWPGDLEEVETIGRFSVVRLTCK